jgi:hypothetical protein
VFFFGFQTAIPKILVDAERAAAARHHQRRRQLRRRQPQSQRNQVGVRKELGSHAQSNTYR